MDTAEDNYKVHLDVFEGPLDLLIYLIRKDDLDIYDIKISKLLDEYLEYLNLAEELNIDLAGEFLEMAAELALIKSKMLLPEQEAEEVEGPDPRADLVAKLIEYQQYKMAAQNLLERPMLGREVFRRPAEPEQTEEGAVLVETDTAALIAAFQNLLKKLPRDQYHEIRERGLDVAERVMELTERLRGQKQIAFEDLFEGDRTRSDLILTFLAILEMAKQRLLAIVQEQVLHHIFVCPLFSEENSVTNL